MRLSFFALLIAFCITSRSASAQAIRINSFRPRPLLTLGDTLTITASPSAVNVPLLAGGTAAATSSITINTTSTGISLLSSINLFAYFASATMALSGSTPVSYIPSSAVLGKCPTGSPTTYTSFTGTGTFGGPGASLTVYSVNTGLSLGFSRNDVLSLEINLSSLPQLPAATYTGTMFLQAQAF